MLRRIGALSLFHEEAQIDGIWSPLIAIVISDGATKKGVSHSLFVVPSSGSHLAAAAVATELAAAAHPPPALKFSALDVKDVPRITAALARIGYGQMYNSPCYCFHHSAKSPSPKDGLVALKHQRLLQAHSGEYQLDKVKLSDAGIINDTWAYRGPRTQAFVESLIEHRFSACVRCKATDKAMAWVLECNDGSIGMLYTVEEGRRKGLASLCVVDITRQLAAAGRDTFCFVVHGNKASLATMESLGFAKLDNMAWAGYEVEAPDVFTPKNEAARVAARASQFRQEAKANNAAHAQQAKEEERARRKEAEQPAAVREKHQRLQQVREAIADARDKAFLAVDN